MASEMSATSSVEFPTFSLLLIALVVALGYGVSLASLVEDLTIFQQVLGLR
jgi:hypothetical protein